MHIIKISPVSFKIVLTKEDLQRCGVSNILEHSELSGDFFAEIIDETNRLYGNPFTGGLLDADFFESKNGGGELFISKRVKSENSIYIFTTEIIENLIMLCKRLYTLNIKDDKGLYFCNGKYSLLIYSEKERAILFSILSEYGNVSMATKLDIWHIQEHADAVIKENAVSTFANTF